MYVANPLAGCKFPGAQYGRSTFSSGRGPDVPGGSFCCSHRGRQPTPRRPANTSTTVVSAPHAAPTLALAVCAIRADDALAKLRGQSPDIARLKLTSSTFAPGHGLDDKGVAVAAQTTYQTELLEGCEGSGLPKQPRILSLIHI